MKPVTQKKEFMWPRFIKSRDPALCFRFSTIVPIVKASNNLAYLQKLLNPKNINWKWHCSKFECNQWNTRRKYWRWCCIFKKFKFNVSVMKIICQQYTGSEACIISQSVSDLSKADFKAFGTATLKSKN